MGGLRTHRLLFAALAVGLAGVLAIPAKLMPSANRTRVAVAFGPSTIGSHPTTSLPAVPSPPPPPAPRREHPIQAPESTPESVGPSDSGGDSVPATNAVAPESVFHDRTPIQRAPTTEAAKSVYAVVIGINDYPGNRVGSRGAVPDAEDMSDVLAMNGVPGERAHAARRRREHEGHHRRVAVARRRRPRPTRRWCCSTPATCARSATRPRRSSRPTAASCPTGISRSRSKVCRRTTCGS